MAAGLLRALTSGAPVPDAAVFGTACAAANVLTPTSGEIYADDVEELLPRVRLTRLG
jgi:fructose-1-phosphate kinase PfkB-like protein